MCAKLLLFVSFWHHFVAQIPNGGEVGVFCAIFLTAIILCDIFNILPIILSILTIVAGIGGFFRQIWGT